jgi:hypothetical protein
MDSNCRMMGVGFRQAFQFTQAERQREILLIKKQTGVMKRIIDVNVRLMAQGWNKLLEEWKAKQTEMKEQLRYILATLTDND